MYTLSDTFAIGSKGNTMKILKNGKQDNKPVQINCYTCKSKLEVEPSDIIRSHFDQRDGNSYEFRCAVCGRGIYVDMSVCKWNGI
jgi:DNA-binding Xre family transcriptional regulator